MNKRKELEKLPLTPEEKARWADMMHQTWQAIGDDAETCMEGARLTKAVIVELVLDANRMMTFAGMTREEDAFLSAIYSRPAFQRWACSIMNY